MTAAVGSLLAATVGTAVPAQAGLLNGTLKVVTGTVTGTTGALVDTTGALLDTTDALVDGADWGYDGSIRSLDSVATEVGASRVRANGYTGAGVGVALIDTGVAAVPGLSSGNVVSGPDLSFDSQSEETRNTDAYGHGTHMAGIIAGKDAASGFRGLAPDATLLSVRVGAADGAVDVSQLVAAIDWVVQHRNDEGMNIRVLNLSGGTDGTQDYRVDPLTHAIENAWRAGIVVVASGGNNGTESPELDNPAYDPFVIAVGAADTKGTRSTLDDTVPDFSSRGSETRRVDLVAPGQSILSLRAPGSDLDTRYPAARSGASLFKGSGSSQAAAVVSGATALLLQQRPDLTPDQVKRMLKATASPMPAADADGRGAGLLDVAAAALALKVPATQGWERSTGLGSLELARGSAHVALGDDELTGEQDIFGAPWSPATWAAASSAGTAWNGGDWNGRTWSGSCWCGEVGPDGTWSARRWSSRTWSGETWSGRRWSSDTWSSHTWSGRRWSSQVWSGRTW